MPISFRVLVPYFEAKNILNQFNSLVESKQNEYALKFFKEKESKYQRLATKGLLYQENSRNKYLLTIPNFSLYLNDTLIPLL